MKTIYMIRHSEAAPRQGSMPDYMRPLSWNGVDSIKILGEFLNKNGVHFDSILTSHAVRAYETALYLAENTHFPNDKIIEDKRLYTADFHAYINILFEQPDDCSCLAIVGHNPQITALVNYFLKGHDAFLLPGATVAVTIDTDKWTDVCLARNEVVLSWTPGKKNK